MDRELTMTPEQTRDQTIAAIIAAGGVVTGTQPMALPSDPDIVAAWQILVTIPDPAVRDAVMAVQAQTQTALTGLIPWADPTTVQEEIP